MLKERDNQHMDRIKLLRELIDSRFNGRQADFSRAIDRSPAQVSQWLSGHRSIGDGVARHIELSLDLPSGYFDGEEAKANIEQLIERGKGHMKLWSKKDPLPEDEFVQVPFYKEVAFKAGNGCCEMEDYNGFTLGFSKATLFRSGINSKDVVCVSVSGNSMEPVLPEGTTIGLDLNRKAIKDGEIYAFKHDDLFRVKVLYRLPGQKIRLKSYNDMEYPEEIVDADQIEIIGLVFWWSVLR